MMEKEQLPEHYKKHRRKQIALRVFWVLLSWLIFYWVFFKMPIPEKMKRTFGSEECTAQGKVWDEANGRCLNR
jgi:hypothetical protein